MYIEIIIHKKKIKNKMCVCFKEKITYLIKKIETNLKTNNLR